MENEKELYNEIGKKIKSRRKKLGITQERLAELTNYSFSFIANIESNTYQSFSISALNLIAKALNCSIKSLLPDENFFNIKIDTIKCSNCEYLIELPPEITRLLNTIQDISHKKLKYTCPKCQKKNKIVHYFIFKTLKIKSIISPSNIFNGSVDSYLERLSLTNL